MEATAFAVQQCDALLKCYTAELLEMDKVRVKDTDVDIKKVTASPPVRCQRCISQQFMSFTGWLWCQALTPFCLRC